MKRNLYAMILGVSSGFGKATALELASKGYNIYGVHMDMGAGKEEAEKLRLELEAMGVQAKFFNKNAASDKTRTKVIEEIQNDFENIEGNNELRILVHSLAFGTLKRFFNPEREEAISRKNLEMTLDVMANSLLYWTQDLFHSELLADNSRIFAFTSIGSSRAMDNYGAVSGAKAALEAYCRQIAMELAPHKITCNALLAGMTATPAGIKIPGFVDKLEYVAEHNPYHRNTLPEDISKMVAMMSDEELYWVTGQTICVDGGEGILSLVDKIPPPVQRK
jgi:NAD(P)-dependent dehydrogenase (short-subunit alcohol dehydrogenase family)